MTSRPAMAGSSSRLERIRLTFASNKAAAVASCSLGVNDFVAGQLIMELTKA